MISRIGFRLCLKTRTWLRAACFVSGCVRLHRRIIQIRLLRRPCQSQNRSLSSRRYSFQTKPSQLRCFLCLFIFHVVFFRTWPSQMPRLLEACFLASDGPAHDTASSTANQARTWLNRDSARSQLFGHFEVAKSCFDE